MVAKSRGSTVTLLCCIFSRNLGRSPVDFNVHYHVDKDVFYPVKRDGMRGDGGTFAAKVGQDYCWMWTARDKPAKLEGRIETK